MANHVSHDLAPVYESLVDAKLPRNLNWTAGIELIAQLGEVKPHGPISLLSLQAWSEPFLKTRVRLDKLRALHGLSA
jgi:hypothetical protein